MSKQASSPMTPKWQKLAEGLGIEIYSCSTELDALRVLYAELAQVSHTILELEAQAEVIRRTILSLSAGSTIGSSMTQDGGRSLPSIH